MRAMQLATRCRAKRDSHKKARLLRQAGQYREAEPRLGVWSVGRVQGIARGGGRNKKPGAEVGIQTVGSGSMLNTCL